MGGLQSVPWEWVEKTNKAFTSTTPPGHFHFSIHLFLSQQLSQHLATKQPFTMPPHGRQKQTQKVDTLGFPMMEVDEIIPLLNELNIKASPQDLYRPTAASVQSLWLQMLESLTGASPDMIENPRRALLGMLEYQVRKAAGGC